MDEKYFRGATHTCAFPCYHTLAMSNALSETLALNEQEVETLMADFRGHERPVSSPYMAFSALKDGLAISIYKKKDAEGRVKVLFQGENAAKVARKYGKPLPKKANGPATISEKAEAKEGVLYRLDQIGSDEVGTGDFFGPVIVCAAYCSKEDIKELERLGVTDSKKMSDDYIRELGPELAKKFDHSLLVLPNEKFNEAHANGLNMNAMKAKMHNRCLYNVHARHPAAKVFQDQFAAPATYYRYVKDDSPILRGIVFAVRGESKYPSVALASVIARYAFLVKMDEISALLGEKVPFGAGPIVDAFAKRMTKKIGKDALSRFYKANFKNASKL